MGIYYFKDLWYNIFSKINWRVDIMSKIIVAYDHSEFEGSKSIKTEKVELEIEGAVTETIVKKHIQARTGHKNVDVKDWVFGNETDLV